MRFVAAAAGLAAMGVAVSPAMGRDAAVPPSVVLFTANDVVHGRELWVSDGTSAGTRMYRDWSYGIGEGRFTLLPTRGRVIALVDNNVTKQRQEVVSIAPDGTMGPNLNPYPAKYTDLFGTAGSRAYFAVQMSGSRGMGYQIYRTEGTAETTKVVLGYDKVQEGGSFSAFQFKGRGYFVVPGSDGVHRVKTVYQDGASPKAVGSYLEDGLGYVGGLVPAGDKIFFAYRTERHGTELWVTDTPGAPGRMVRNINPFQLDGLAPGTRMVPLGGGVLFYGVDQAKGARLWFSDGTAAGTRPLSDVVSAGYALNSMKVHRGKAYFVSTGGTGFDLWESDGTPAGTRRIPLTVGGYTASVADQGVGTSFAFLGDRIVFAGSVYPRGTVLMRFDLKTRRTEVVKDINRDDWDAAFNLTTVGDRIFFSAQDYYNRVNEGNNELWVTDGTAAGTRVVKEIVKSPYRGSYPMQLTAVPTR